MQQDEELSVVCFIAGGYAFAVEASQIGGMLDTAPAKFTSVEELLGLTAATNSFRRWLRVGERYVEVGEPVALCFLPIGSIYHLPEFIRMRIQLKGIKALAVMDKPVLLVDLNHLFDPIKSPG